MSYIKCDSGLFVEVHPTKEYTARDGDLLFKLNYPTKPNERFFGYDKLSKNILTMIANKHIVFSDNETGDLFQKFIYEALGKKI